MNFLKRILSPLQNCEETALMLCRELNVPVTETTLVNDLQEHPDYPSLLSVSDILNNLGVANLSLKTELENLNKLPFPLVVQVKGKKTHYDLFAVVYGVKENGVEWLNPEIRKRETVSSEQFSEIYRGVVQVYEKAATTGEKDFVANRKKEKTSETINALLALSIPLLTLLIAVFAFVKHGFAATLFPFIFTLLALTGVVTGALLLLYEVYQYNPVLQKVCTAGGKTNCAAILHSKGSKIFGISWSVIGFSYFMGLLATQLLSGLVNPTILSVAAWLGVLALPYTVFSIYYQARVIRQWCPMCLTVQGVLVLQVLTAFVGQFFAPINTVSLSALFPFAVSMLVVFLAVYLLLPALEKSKANKHHRMELQRLKHNPQIFEALLTKQKQISTSTEGLGVSFGNPNAKHKVIQVCSPYCGHCSTSHMIIEELTEINPDIHLQIIFTAAPNDFRAPVVRHFMAIAEQENKMYVKEVLNDWFRDTEFEYSVFSIKHPADIDVDLQNTRLELMDKWNKEINIEFTPTFFINGHQLPEMYSVADLKYLLSV